VLTGIALLALVSTMAMSGIWSALLVVNLRYSPAVPWAVLPMTATLWVAWQYAGGKWWPSRTASLRRRHLRANPVRGSIFAAALLAGFAGVAALTGLWILLFQTGLMRGNALPDLSGYPAQTLVGVVVTAALVGSMAEEAGFRGYLQVGLEGDVAAPAAIIIAAVALIPGHGLTQGFAWPTVVFYLLVDTMLGVIAYLTNSIWPGIVVHATGLLTFFVLVWPFDSARLVGVEAFQQDWFWIHVAQTVVFGALALLVFGHLVGTDRLDLVRRRAKPLG
jgi:membrane protease YdiL (CAAX protease family)